MNQTIGTGRKLRLAVMISGRGTNLQALIDRAADGRLNAEVAVVVCDRPEAYGIQRAKKAGIPVEVVDYKHYLKAPIEDLMELPLPPGVDLDALEKEQLILENPDRDKRMARLRRLVLAEGEMVRIMDSFEPDIVCTAGFMRLMTPYILNHYNRGGGDYRVVNVHPSLLPAFKGQYGYRDTFQYGCKWGGVTIHYVDLAEDAGPVITQAVYPIWPEDTVETVEARGLSLEYEMFAQSLNWIAAGQVRLKESEVGRYVAVIEDPDYRNFQKRWMEQAFGKSKKRTKTKTKD